MADSGDVFLADVNDEQRHLVLVVSSRRFHELSGRAYVLPAASSRPFPWRIEHGDTTFAADLLQTLPTGRLFEHTDRASQVIVRKAQTAIRLITS